LSSAQIAAKMIRQLEEEDWITLHAVEKLIPNFEAVPLERIAKVSGLYPSKLQFHLGRLNLFGLMMTTPFGYTLNTAGLDAIALNALVKRDIISGLGRAVGMGKESDVFEATNDRGDRLVVKFYRIGRVSFRTTRKSRAYISPQMQHQWLTVNVHAAMKEEEGMQRAGKVGVTTPKFVARERHALVMSEIEGVMLYHCASEDVVAPRNLLHQVLDNVKLAFTKAKIINGDLSEYNILYDGERPWIIDWPQFVDSSHKNSEELLRRDVENSISFFKRKFGLEVDTDAAVKYVKGKVNSPFRVGDRRGRKRT